MTSGVAIGVVAIISGRALDGIQTTHERAVGDAFVDWYNAQQGTAYTYRERGADPPDLLYGAGGQPDLALEITVAYYDAAYATLLWQAARGVTEDEVRSWWTRAPNSKLLTSVNHALEKKSTMTLAQGCVLVVAVYADLTSAAEFAAMIPDMKTPARHPFAAIYVGGLFPESSDGSPGGYSWWRLTRQRPLQ